VAKKVVVVGGGIAGLYFTYRLLSAAGEVEDVLVDPKDYHEFAVGVPMAVAGLVEFKDLLFPFRQLTKAKFVKARVAKVDGKCGRPAVGSGLISGDYLVLAPGALHIGTRGLTNSIRLLMQTSSQACRGASALQTAQKLRLW